MHAEAIRKRMRRLAVGVIAVVAGAGFAAPLPATATPSSCSGSACLVFFDGPMGFGLTSATGSHSRR